MAVHLRRAPVAVEQRGGPQRRDHGVRYAGPERRDGEGTVTQQVGHHAAEADHYDRAELGIGR